MVIENMFYTTLFGNDNETFDDGVGGISGDSECLNLNNDMTTDEFKSSKYKVSFKIPNWVLILTGITVIAALIKIFYYKK